MPKAKNPMTEEERSKRFKAEVRKRSKAGDFDLDAAENALDKLVRQRGKSSP
jgi:hypothetical protein